MMINKNIFESNFADSVAHLIKSCTNQDLNKNDFCFLLIPIFENGKKHNSTDEYIERWLLNEKNTKNRIFDFNSATKILTCMDPYFPLWIKMSIFDLSEKVCTVKLEVSLRFRDSKIISNQKLKYPPFVICNE
jgi:hypothetical protein